MTAAHRRLAATLTVGFKDPSAHGDLVAALALTGRDAEARESLQRYLARSLHCIFGGWWWSRLRDGAVPAPYTSTLGSLSIVSVI
jgi:hypothetical protein